MSTYQVMPPLTSEERADLEQSIKANGILVPVLIDDGGEIIDGHHRAEIADRLGIDYLQITKAGTPTELRTLAYSLNLHRRHLSREQVRALVETSLKADPQLSDREHARRTGSSHPTVADVRDHLEDAGDVEELSTRTDSLGRQQPAAKVRTDLGESDQLDTFSAPATKSVPAPKLTEAEALAARDAQEHKDAVRRMAGWVGAFLMGWDCASHMRTNQWRDEVLAALDDHDRGRFLTIEKGLR